MRTPEMYITKHNAQVAGLKAVALIKEADRFKVDYHAQRVGRTFEQGYIVRLIDTEGNHLGVLPEGWAGMTQPNQVRAFADAA